MAAKTSPKHDVAILVARARDGAEIERAEMPPERYYEQLHEMLDSSEYRVKRGIVVIEGQLIDHSGDVFQEFRNRYSELGRYEGGRTVHSDGTVNED